MYPILLFGVAALAELYFFLFQRSALEISRRQNLDPVLGRHMIPLWYAAVWPVRVVKWVAAVLVFRAVGLAAALGCLAATFLLTSLAPVPHRHFRPFFERRVQALHAEQPEIAAKLALALLRDQ